MISFYPNCTLPVAPGVFVASANVRGTMDIIWSCGTILIISCWSILHQNIPTQFRPKSKMQSIRRDLFLSFQKLKWVVTILMAPEIVLTKAILDNRSANVFRKPLEEIAQKDEVPWSLSHTFFANMGGIHICFPREDDGNPDDPETSVTISTPTTNLSQEDTNRGLTNPILLKKESTTNAEPRKLEGAVHEPAGLSAQGVSPQGIKEPRPIEGKANMRIPRFRDFERARNRYYRRIKLFGRLFGELTWRPSKRHSSMSQEIKHRFSGMIRGAAVYKSSSIQRNNLFTVEGNIWILNAPQLLMARRYGIIKCLPSISEDEIVDKSKSDILIKAISIIQIIWLIAQLILRVIYDKASTQLEIMTVAYSICAVITYVLVMHQPQNANTPIEVPTSALECTIDQMKHIVEIGSLHFLPFLDFQLPGIQYNSFQFIQDPKDCEGDIIEKVNRRTQNYIYVSLVVAAAVFGSVHLLAWNFAFPTHIERLLWIISSFLTALLPLLAQAIWLLGNQGSHRTEIETPWYFAFVTVIISVITLARLYLFAEVFRSLYFLPPSAFSSTSAANAPHVG